MTCDFSPLDGLLPVLPDHARQPVMFLGHGNPMNALGGPFHDSWSKWGQHFGPGQRWARPRLILCISAHWLTQGWWLTAMAAPPTIHDFGGFPQTLLAQQYPVPGAPEVAEQLSRIMRQPRNGKDLGLDHGQWGLDHGAWSVLKPMFPQGDIPVIQLSMDLTAPAADHAFMGRQLNGLRERGVLVVGSGNTVHNLRAMRAQTPDNPAHAWAVQFDGWVQDCLLARDGEALQQWAAQGEPVQLSHPTPEHFLPLLYAEAASDGQDEVTFFNTTFELSAISMRSVVWT